MRELPTGWIWTAVGDACDINPRYFDVMPGDDAFVSKVPMAAVEAESGRLDPSELVTYGSVKGKSLTPFQENDVLFAKVTPCMENGKIALARSLHGGRAVGSTELFALRSKGAIEPSYLMYFLLQSSVRREAQRAMTGAVGLRRVPRAFLSSLQIPLPQLAMQQHIVAAIEESLAHIDSGMESINTASKYISRWNETLLAKAVNGGLSKESSGSAAELLSEIRARRESLASRSRKPPTPTAIDGYNLPSGWEMASLGEISYDWSYGTSTKCSYEAAGIPVLRIPNVINGKVEAANGIKFAVDATLDLSGLFLKPGDLLFVRTNGSPDLIGRVGIVDTSLDIAFASYLIRFRLIPDGVLPSWVRIVVNSPIWRRHIVRSAASSAGQHNINSKLLASMPIPIPPRDEQLEVVSKLGQWQQQSEVLEGTMSLLKKRARLLRESIFAYAFSGRLVREDSAVGHA